MTLGGLRVKKPKVEILTFIINSAVHALKDNKMQDAALEMIARIKLAENESILNIILEYVDITYKDIEW